MLEAYKKYILTSLILHGHVAPFPSSLEGSIKRQLSNAAPKYAELALPSTEPHQIKLIVESNAGVFSSDRNHGLARQAIQSVADQAVIGLTKCYVTLSLADMATQLQLDSPEAAENQLLRMIESGKINAVIHGDKGTVKALPFSPKSHRKVDNIT